MPFSFKSVGAGNVFAYNGGSIDVSLLLAFKIVSPTRAYAFLEDIAIGGDRDLDDMVVRIDVSPVPLPAAFPLMGGVLGIGGLISWRRRRRHQRLAVAA